MADPETEELHVEQVKREVAERRRADSADEPAEAAQHGRRAERAAYLRERLEERARAEEAAGASPPDEQEPGVRP